VEIAPQTRMGLVELSVSDLSRSVDYWRDAVGLRSLAREDGVATLGTDLPLLRLVEQRSARPDSGHTGLFHVALLVPDRASLARFLAHAARARIPLEGLSDHDVSEAIYLRDPDLHGVEVYADRPRALWDGHVMERMTTRPLDVESLLGELDDPAAEPFAGLPDGTIVGHVHFRVAEIEESIRFYHDVLGMGLMAQLGQTAAFLGAGGYHHHVGANTWESRGAAPAPLGSATLRHATVVLPDAAERDRVAARVADAGQEPEVRADGIFVRDPAGNGLLLAAPS
jgi:catechol 2,3-dioxygenase